MLMADEIILFISDLNSPTQVISNFNKFTQCSGRKLKIDKTEIILLGNLKVKINSLPNDLWGYSDN